MAFITDSLESLCKEWMGLLTYIFNTIPPANRLSFERVLDNEYNDSTLS